MGCLLSFSTLSLSMKTNESSKVAELLREADFAWNILRKEQEDSVLVKFM